MSVKHTYHCSLDGNRLRKDVQEAPIVILLYPVDNFRSTFESANHVGRCKYHVCPA